MTSRKTNVDPELVQMLDFAGVPWEIVPRKRHAVLQVAGRQVLVLPRGAWENSGRAALNARACLRRHLREHHAPSTK